LEARAKQERIGAWGINCGGLDARPQKSSAVSSFIPEQKTRSRSVPEGSKTHGKQNAALGKIDINTATEKELTNVLGIGHVWRPASSRRDHSEAPTI